MNEKKKEEKNKKMINVDEKSIEDVKMKKIIQKILERESEFKYNNVRKRQYKEFECANVHNILYR